MKSRIPDSIAELYSEVQALEQLKAEIVDTWVHLPSQPREKRIHESAIALLLHNFYTGCEKMFEIIADDFNGGVPQSKDWHKRLFHSMTLDLPGIRPPVLSAECENLLAEFLAFRHIVRNIYAFRIDSDRLALLMKRFEPAFECLRRDIAAFIELLKKI